MATPDRLRELLLDPEEAAAMDAPGKTDAAVLVPLFERAGDLTAVFTERRDDLRRHAGEISFPGGRQDEPGRGPARHRPAGGRGGDRPGARTVSSWWARFRRSGTFVTGYRVFPFVGWIQDGNAWAPQETEVEQVLELSLPDLVRGYERKRLIRRGVPIKTPTYTVDGHFVWGATGADRRAPARKAHARRERAPRH